ncbi:hypothetical protein BpHYR1_040906 [Brachionus plicatilis]|uniref:Uncharacterized protein n=1 Tax=Brachionus plicatilis TaxID=10195 RepID=A0A3M7QIU5_BRAPC|nr:hypothetical protein BpHYR1_040906 [Brachionus plicatilis]
MCILKSQASYEVFSQIETKLLCQIKENIMRATFPRTNLFFVTKPLFTRIQTNVLYLPDVSWDTPIGNDVLNNKI